MIVVRVEMWPGGFEANKRELMRLEVCNDGTGTESHGNYHCRMFRKGSNTGILRVGRVANFPRQSYHVGRLILRALAECFPEERRND